MKTISSHRRRIEHAIGIALGSLAIAARGAPCGNPCSTPFSEIVTVPPTGNGADAAMMTIPMGPIPVATCSSYCMHGPVQSCTGITLDGGAPAVECHYGTVCSGSGRRPAGLVVRAKTRFARMAALEAASVRAFEILASELETHGAPVRLVRACLRAAKDEARHARIMNRIARRNGERAARVTLPSAKRRSLYAIARENALEGCVSEAFGAFVLHVESARMPELASVAQDEVRHAALSFAIAEWIAPKLSARDRRRIERAKARRVRRVPEARAFFQALA